MAIKVRIKCNNTPSIYSNYIMDIVRDLRKRGYVQGIHFDFAFVPSEIDPNNFETIEEKHTMFTFYKEEIATWFSLLYQ